MNKYSNPLSLLIKPAWLFILGARIKTLPAVLAPVAMSSAWAFYQTGSLKKDILFFTLFSALFIQLAVNFFNDALDGQTGLDSSLRKGPVRLVQSGLWAFVTVKNLGFFCCAMAFLMGLPLIFRGGGIILGIGALSCLCAYFYTGTRFSFLKLGLSEFFCFLFFGPIAVFGTYYLQTLTGNISLVYLGIQCGLWALSLLLINHLRDEEEDRKGGRKHFVILYGRTNVLFFLSVGQAFIYLFCFYWLGLSLKSGVLSFFILPLSAGLIYLLSQTPPSEKYNSYLAFCSALYVLFSSVWIFGLLY